MSDIKTAEYGSKALTMPRQQPSSASPEAASDRAVAGLVARLLLHFWTPQELSEGARAAMAADWLCDLREFGPEVVSIACGEWRRSQTRRPTIADIRSLCVTAQRQHAEAEDVRALPPPDDREERRRQQEISGSERARKGRALANEWAQRHGFPSIDAYAEAKDIHWSEAYMRVIQENLANSPLARGIPHVAESLGVKAREWTLEEMRRGRIELGLEDAAE